MNKERDKFLTEVMGECWHDALPSKEISFGKTYTKCKKCGTSQFKDRHLDFSTPDGFFKLWNWAITQEWWDNFVVYIHKGSIGTPYMKSPRISQIFIHPDKFADSIYAYLK